MFGTGGNVEQPRHVVAGCRMSEDLPARPVLDHLGQGWVLKGVARGRETLQVNVHLHDVVGRTVLPLPELPEVEDKFRVSNRWTRELGRMRVLQNHYVHQSLAFYHLKMRRRGYWLDIHKGEKTYTMERFDREDPIFSAIPNDVLFQKHADYYDGAAAACPAPSAASD